MNNILLKTLKEKLTESPQAGVYRDNEGVYRIKSFASYDDVPEEFINDVEKELSKPIEQKTLFFKVFNSNRFKRNLLLAYPKHDAFEEFENAFHSFFKNFSAEDLFHVFDTTNYLNTKKTNHPYDPYILFLLKQDYSNQPSFSPSLFLNILRFKFTSNPQNYLELKESLYCFLDTHYLKAKESYSKYSDEETKDRKTKEFDLEVFHHVKKHIKSEEINQFEKFWPSIIIDKSQKNTFLVEPKETFYIFNIQNAYLNDNFPSLSNIEYAKKGCQFIESFINKNFSDYLELTILKTEDQFCQFLAKFKNQSINKENISYIFNSVLTLNEELSSLDNHSLRKQYSEKYNEGFEKIKKEIHYITLKNILPENTLNKGNKMKI